MSEGNARAFAERLGKDDGFRHQLFDRWIGAQAPTLTDITIAGNHAGYTFTIDDLRIVLKKDSQMRENIASLEEEFHFKQRPAEYEDGPEIYPNDYPNS